MRELKISNPKAQIWPSSEGKDKKRYNELLREKDRDGRRQMNALKARNLSRDDSSSAILTFSHSRISSQKPVQENI